MCGVIVKKTICSIEEFMWFKVNIECLHIAFNAESECIRIGIKKEFSPMIFEKSLIDGFFISFMD